MPTHWVQFIAEIEAAHQRDINAVAPIASCVGCDKPMYPSPISSDTSHDVKEAALQLGEPD